MIVQALLFGYGITGVLFIIGASIYMGVIKLHKVITKNPWEL